MYKQWHFLTVILNDKLSVWAMIVYDIDYVNQSVWAMIFYEYDIEFWWYSTVTIIYDDANFW